MSHLSANELGRRLVAKDRLCNKLEIIRYICKQSPNEQMSLKDVEELIYAIEWRIKKELEIPTTESTSSIK